MSTTYAWIGDVAETPHLGEELIDDKGFNRFRLMFERTRLLERANSICRHLNAQAGEMLIFSETFTANHPLIARYTIEDETDNITMELAILPEGPGVVFSSKNARPLLRRIQRFCGIHTRHNSSVVCKLLINPVSVSEGEIQEWFTYLLSGLHHSFKPQPMEPILMKSWLGAINPSFQLTK